MTRIIVLCRSIEERREQEEERELALIDAGIFHIGPVKIGVSATVIRSLPLSAMATFITLGLVSVLYSLFVLDLQSVGRDGSTLSHIQASTPASRAGI